MLPTRTQQDKSLVEESEASFRERMESVRMCRENFWVGVVEHPTLTHLHRVGRSLVPMVPGVPFPSDLLRNSKCESLPEMTRFIDVLSTEPQAG